MDAALVPSHSMSATSIGSGCVRFVAWSFVPAVMRTGSHTYRSSKWRRSGPCGLPPSGGDYSRAVKTLHTAYRVSDLPRSLDFYRALGYEEVGRVGGAPGCDAGHAQTP